MKRIFSLLFGLTLCAGSVLGQGPSFRYAQDSFINGSGFLVVSNNTTYTAFGSNVLIRSSSLLSNVIPNQTNTPFLATRDIAITTDALGQVEPATFYCVLNDTNWYIPNNQYVIPTNIVIPGVSIQGGVTNSLPTSTNTSILTFTFAKIVSRLPLGGGGYSNICDTSTTNQFSCNVTQNGTTVVALTTNFPTAFLSGAQGVRLISVANPSVANAAPCYITDCGIGHWIP